MPVNHYVTLGRSGLRVSPLCLGAMTFGEDWGWGSSVADSEMIIDRYLAVGGNFIDTANGYTKGHSEKIIGDHVGRREGVLEQVLARVLRIVVDEADGLFPGSRECSVLLSRKFGPIRALPNEWQPIVSC